ncbi:MAG TPA: hypothetical protein VNK23_15370 [Candidatus Dormibacteraeota bacterium]|nr:hypothetical protein [Candidatus Dormibacteraeota bacterium]
MRGKIILSGLILALSGAVASAQSKPMAPSPGTVYCSGIVTTERVPRSTYVITGEDSNYRILYSDGDEVFFNKGANDGVKAGDEFLVERPVQDPYIIQWTKWEDDILHKMGTMWDDEARLKVIVARPKVSIAQVEDACDYVQRGDIVVPFTERATPEIKVESHFDKFAPPNGKAMAMIIAGKNYVDTMGNQSVAYVNLGNAQGVKVGDYFKIFRYQGTQHETVYQTPRYAFDQEFDMGVKDVHMMGYGAVPQKWNWSNVPRENIGEAVVLRTAPNSSTVLITYSLMEIFPGDYVELQ